MKKSGNEVVPFEGDTKEYYKEAALDSLLYWTNATVEISGVNTTMTLLTEMLATCITHMVPASGADQAEKVITSIIKDSFTAVREKSTQVSGKSSDKKNMN